MPTVIPISGATKAERVVENGQAAAVELNEEEMAEIDEMIAISELLGDRYHPAVMKSING